MAKKISRRGFLKQGLKAGALAVPVGGAAVGTWLGAQALRKRAAGVREERRAEIRRKIAGSKLSIDPEKWMPFFEIYKFDLRSGAARNFVDGVNRFCAEKKMPLKTFFLTLEQHQLDSYHIRQQRKSVQEVLYFCLEKHKAEATRAKKVPGSLDSVRALPE